MPNKYHLESVQQDVTDTPVDLGIGATPEGETRFIIFVKMTATTIDSTLTLSEGSDATTPVKTRDKQRLKSDGDTIMYPDSPDVDKPLFKFAEGKYVVLGMDAGKTASVTIGYSDG